MATPGDGPEVEKPKLLPTDNQDRAATANNQSQGTTHAGNAPNPPDTTQATDVPVTQLTGETDQQALLDTAAKQTTTGADSAHQPSDTTNPERASGADQGSTNSTARNGNKALENAPEHSDDGHASGTIETKDDTPDSKYARSKNLQEPPIAPSQEHSSRVVAPDNGVGSQEATPLAAENPGQEDKAAGPEIQNAGPPQESPSDGLFYSPETSHAPPLAQRSGAAMFPSLSTAQQEQMSWEALAQAEDTIVADTDGLDRANDYMSDGGYESEGFSSGSTSAESSIRDYMFENGRRYHRFREGSYNFPNDDVEQEREDMKHAMIKLLCGQKLHFAPIGDNPQEVLDIGTGTGIWVIESKELH